jgi:hypothetical protein
MTEPQVDGSDVGGCLPFSYRLVATLNFLKFIQIFGVAQSNLYATSLYTTLLTTMFAGFATFS